VDRANLLKCHGPTTVCRSLTWIRCVSVSGLPPRVQPNFRRGIVLYGEEQVSLCGKDPISCEGSLIIMFPSQIPPSGVKSEATGGGNHQGQACKDNIGEHHVRIPKLKLSPSYACLTLTQYEQSASAMLTAVTTPCEAPAHIIQRGKRSRAAHGPTSSNLGELFLRVGSGGRTFPINSTIPKTYCSRMKAM